MEAYEVRELALRVIAFLVQQGELKSKIQPRSESGFESPVSFWGWPPGVALGVALMVKFLKVSFVLCSSQN